MLIAKAVLRSTHSFKLIDPKQKLEKGVNISEETVVKIKSLIPKILRQEKDASIDYIKGSKIFRLKEHPNLVFKMSITSHSKNLHKGRLVDDTDMMEYRFDNMVQSKGICLINNLGLLIIPHAKKLTFNSADNRKCVIIAEERMDINHNKNIDLNEKIQEENYRKYSKELDETTRQLAIFVAKTGFNDVRPSNIPILNEVADFHGPRRVALIDHEHMESSINGFCGDFNGSPGLIGCVSEAHIDIVIAEAQKQGVITDQQAVKAKNKRLQRLKSAS